MMQHRSSSSSFTQTVFLTLTERMVARPTRARHVLVTSALQLLCHMNAMGQKAGLLLITIMFFVSFVQPTRLSIYHHK